MKGSRAAALELGDPAFPYPLRRRGPEAELGQRGAQVQPGAADDDGAPAGRQQLVDLGMGELGVLTGAERRVDGKERDEPVVELGALGSAVAAPVRVSSPA